MALFLYLASENKGDTSKPIIRPVFKYRAFQPGSTFELTCETTTSASMQNVTWQLPDSGSSFTPKGTTEWTKTGNFIKTTLKISSATYADTGYYTCQNVDDETVFSEQFVFIQGISRNDPIIKLYFNYEISITYC